MNIKPIVHYRGKAVLIGTGMPGTRAYLTPIDHPDPHGLVSNEQPVMTSEIVNSDPETGVIETANTLYVPMKEQL